MGGDTWLAEYDGCMQLGQDLMEQINERNKHARTSSTYTKLSAQIRTQTRKFTSDLNRLKQNLLRASSSYHITQREVERRQGMMDGLITKEKQIEEANKNQGGSRTQLLGASGGDTFSRSDPWGMAEEPDIFRDMSNRDVQQQQQYVIAEQDRGLEALGNVISRQRQMAIDIGNEVDDQNELIDEIGDHMDRTDGRIQRETRHISIIDRKAAGCCYYLIIVFLFVAIVVVVAVPYKGKP